MLAPNVSLHAAPADGERRVVYAHGISGTASPCRCPARFGFGFGREVELTLGLERRQFVRQFDLADPFAPDLNKQRHQNRADEKAEKAHCLHPTDQTEEGREEGQLDRPAD